MSENKMIITIGRQYGSTGYEIGKKLANDLGIKLYDKEMLKRAAQESGLCEEIFETHDEKPTSSFLYSLVMGSSMGYPNTYADMPLNHKVFLAQFDAIKKIASEGPCVMVGRCADYALEEFDHVANIFVYADLEARIRRVARELDMSDAKAKDFILKNDKKRASYYNYYTNKEWGDAKGYDLCLNSAKLGIDGAVEVIKSYLEIRNNVEKPIL